jgi:hypothetical protein
MQPITLHQFNLIHESHNFARFNGMGYYRQYYKLTKLKEVKKGEKEWTIDDDFKVELVTITEAVKKQVFDTDSFNKLILRYLRLFTPVIKAALTDTKGFYNPKTGQWMTNKSDKGRADITAQYKDFELGIETKQKYESQKEAQKEFEQMAAKQSFRKYVLVRSFDDFQLKMFEIFPGLPTQENWQTFIQTKDERFLKENKRLIKLINDNK